ncbi:MAG: hypothetical protein K0Q57_10 [Gammaproteobacteria bacterium]|jgi:hypothetical protein|nr:hypothetical protein [Gammaproteobacteria bacterium]
MTGIELAVEARNIIQNVISPLLSITNIISRFLGVFLILYGMVRLYRHGEHNMMHRISPLGTIMTFVSGTVLIAYTPELSVLSSSLFGNPNYDLVTACPSGGVDQQTGVIYCPILGYLSEIPPNSPLTTETQVIKTLAFAVLFLVGTISFIRGFLELIKAGEGHGQGGVAKAITHIFAGVAGVNAESLYNLIENIFTSNIT